jgi:hypothetical protein
MVTTHHRNQGLRNEAEAPLLHQMAQTRHPSKDRACRELATNAEPVVRNATA